MPDIASKGSRSEESGCTDEEDRACNRAPFGLPFEPEVYIR